MATKISPKQRRFLLKITDPIRAKFDLVGVARVETDERWELIAAVSKLGLLTRESSGTRYLLNDQGWALVREIRAAMEIPKAATA